MPTYDQRLLDSGGAPFQPAGGPATELDANGTTLTVDAIVDGEFLKRVGTTVVSAAVSGGSGLTQPQVMARSFGRC